MSHKKYRIKRKAKKVIKKKLIKRKAGSIVSKQEVCRVMDYMDEVQVLAELQGKTELLEKYVYCFPMGDKEIYGFSWVGAKALARRRGHIRIDEPILQLTTYNSVVAKVSATDLKRNINYWGVADQSRIMRKWDKNTKSYVSDPDNFAVQKATSKAQRNAILHVVPAEEQQKCLNIFKRNKKNILMLDQKSAPPKDKTLNISPATIPQLNGNIQQVPGGIVLGTIEEVNGVPVSTNNKPVVKETPKSLKCEKCGSENIGPRLAEISKKKTGKILCNICLAKEVKK